MKKILFFTLLFVGLSWAVAHAQSLNLQSYFPAPFAAYDRLRLTPLDNTDGNTPQLGQACVGLEGTIVVVDASPELRICLDTPTGPEWTTIPSVWTLNGNNLYPTETEAPTSNDDIQVGIGTDTPATKLHVVHGSGAAVVRLEGGDDSGVTLWEAGATPSEKGSLTFNGSDDLILQSRSGKIDLNAAAGGSASHHLTLDTTGYVGINTITPTALLEVAAPASLSGSYLAISESDTAADNGSILEIDDDGDVYINKPGAGSTTDSKLEIMGDDDASAIGFLDRTNNFDFWYNGDGGAGAGGSIAHFVHTGDAAVGQLIFEDSGGDNLLRLTNTGLLHVMERLTVGKIQPDKPHIDDRTIPHNAVEVHIHEKNALGGDVIMLLSDQGTDTGVNGGTFDFIEADTVGLFMPSANLWGNYSASQRGGLMVTGISTGQDSEDPAGLELTGLIGIPNPGSIPAVEIDGTKLNASGGLVKMDGGDVVLGINYSTNNTNDEDGIVFLANGQVGVGFDYPDKPDAGVDMHIKNSIELEPLVTFPFACTATVTGALYADTDHSLCFCNGSDWVPLNNLVGPCD